MSPSLTKNLLITNLTLLSLILLCSPAKAAKYHYLLNFDARYGVHTIGPANTATNRHTVELEQKNEYNENWSSVLGLRAETESAYATVPERYGTGDVAKYDSQTFLPRDNFLQFQNGSFRSRLGYQQVVWGEAFGSYYADIVNPKDYREAGLGDLARNRLALPLLNLQWIAATSSAQILYIPKSMSNLLPKYGSDFNTFKLPGAFSSVPFSISRDPTAAPTRGEYGLRLTKQISIYDFSAFYLDYYDRNPVFQLQTVFFPFSITAVPDYKRLQTVGTTLTIDLDGYLFRSEVLQHINRELNTIEGTNLSSAKTNELVYVFGLDLPQFEKWQMSFQFSESRVRNEAWAARPNTQSIAGARIAKTFSNDFNVELQNIYLTSDASNLTQASLTMPISNQAEFLFGLDKFDGADGSQLGQLKNASRAWILVRAALKK